MVGIQHKPVSLQTHALNHYAMLPQVDGNGIMICSYSFIAGSKYLRTKFLEDNFVCICQEP